MNIRIFNYLIYFIFVFYRSKMENKTTTIKTPVNTKNKGGRSSVVLTDGAAPTLQQSIAFSFS